MISLKTLDMITDELRRAERKHPGWPEDKLRQAAIVAEEAGELLRESLSYTESRERGQTESYYVYQMRMRDEAVQTAAMAIRYLENFKFDGTQA